MVSDEKALQRKRLREQRKALDGPVRAEADAAIMRNVVALDEFARADVIFPYLSMGLMEWYEVTSFDGLVKSSFGVEEPVPDTATALNPRDFPNSIALVPGLSFDAQGYRMGYGGGFYDKYLHHHKEVHFTKVALCFAFQLYDHIPTKGHDEKMDLILTPDEVLA